MATYSVNPPEAMVQEFMGASPYSKGLIYPPQPPTRPRPGLEHKSNEEGTGCNALGAQCLNYSSEDANDERWCKSSRRASSSSLLL